MKQHILVLYSLILLFMLFSFLINGVESGVFALNYFKLRRQAKNGKRTALRILKVAEHAEQFFWTNAIGGTICNAITIFLIIFLSFELFQRPYNILHLIFCLMMFYLLSCLFPKIFARKNPNLFYTFAIVPYRLLFTLCYPIGTITQHIFKTNQSLYKLLFSDRKQFREYLENCPSNLTNDELTMVGQVMEFFEKTVQDIIIPMDKVTRFSSTMTLREAKEIANRTNLTRFPVYNDDKRQNAIGILSMKVVLYKENAKDCDSISEHITQSLFFDCELPLSQALTEMRKSGRRLAIARNQSGKELGIITLQDILTAIFGQIKL